MSVGTSEYDRDNFQKFIELAVRVNDTEKARIAATTGQQAETMITELDELLEQVKTKEYLFNQVVFGTHTEQMLVETDAKDFTIICNFLSLIRHQALGITATELVEQLGYKKLKTLNKKGEHDISGILNDMRDLDLLGMPVNDAIAVLVKLTTKRFKNDGGQTTTSLAQLTPDAVFYREADKHLLIIDWKSTVSDTSIDQTFIRYRDLASALSNSIGLNVSGVNAKIVNFSPRRGVAEHYPPETGNTEMNNLLVMINQKIQEWFGREEFRILSQTLNYFNQVAESYGKSTNRRDIPEFRLCTGKESISESTDYLRTLAPGVFLMVWVQLILGLYCDERIWEHDDAVEQEVNYLKRLFETSTLWADIQLRVRNIDLETAFDDFMKKEFIVNCGLAITSTLTAITGEQYTLGKYANCVLNLARNLRHAKTNAENKVCAQIMEELKEALEKEPESMRIELTENFYRPETKNIIDIIQRKVEQMKREPGIEFVNEQKSKLNFPFPLLPPNNNRQALSANKILELFSKKAVNALTACIDAIPEQLTTELGYLNINYNQVSKYIPRDFVKSLVSLFTKINTEATIEEKRKEDAEWGLHKTNVEIQREVTLLSNVTNTIKDTFKSIKRIFNQQPQGEQKVIRTGFVSKPEIRLMDFDWIKGLLHSQSKQKIKSSQSFCPEKFYVTLHDGSRIDKSLLDYEKKRDFDKKMQLNKKKLLDAFDNRLLCEQWATDLETVLDQAYDENTYFGLANSKYHEETFDQIDSLNISTADKTKCEFLSTRVNNSCYGANAAVASHFARGLLDTMSYISTGVRFLTCPDPRMVLLTATGSGVGDEANVSYLPMVMLTKVEFRTFQKINRNDIMIVCSSETENGDEVLVLCKPRRYNKVRLEHLTRAESMFAVSAGLAYSSAHDDETGLFFHKKTEGVPESEWKLPLPLFMLSLTTRLSVMSIIDPLKQLKGTALATTADIEGFAREKVEYEIDSLSSAYIFWSIYRGVTEFQEFSGNYKETPQTSDPITEDLITTGIKLNEKLFVPGANCYSSDMIKISNAYDFLNYMMPKALQNKVVNDIRIHATPYELEEQLRPFHYLLEEGRNVEFMCKTINMPEDSDYHFNKSFLYTNLFTKAFSSRSIERSLRDTVSSESSFSDSIVTIKPLTSPKSTFEPTHVHEKSFTAMFPNRPDLAKKTVDSLVANYENPDLKQKIETRVVDRSARECIEYNMSTTSAVLNGLSSEDIVRKYSSNLHHVQNTLRAGIQSVDDQHWAKDLRKYFLNLKISKDRPAFMADEDWDFIMREDFSKCTWKDIVKRPSSTAKAGIVFRIMSAIGIYMVMCRSMPVVEGLYNLLIRMRIGFSESPTFAYIYKTITHDIPVLVREFAKNQRTLIDREIYIVCMAHRIFLYCIEHIAKAYCMKSDYEMITVGGDRKVKNINSMANTARKHCNDLKKELKRKEMSTGHGMRAHVMYGNIDNSKWSAYSNTNIFCYQIFMFGMLSPLEKNKLFLNMLNYTTNKFVTVNPQVTGKLFELNKRAHEAGVPDKYAGKLNDIVRTDTVEKSQASNVFRVTHNWLQGNFNYLSSLIHTVAMSQYISTVKAFMDFADIKYASIYYDHREHSDDSCIAISGSFGCSQYFLGKMLSTCLQRNSRLFGIKTNIKKTHFSPIRLEFVSQNNLHGESVPSYASDLAGCTGAAGYTGFAGDLLSRGSHIQSLALKACPVFLHLLAQISAIKYTLTHYNMMPGMINSLERLTQLFSRSSIPLSLGGFRIMEPAYTVYSGFSGMDLYSFIQIVTKYERINPDYNDEAYITGKLSALAGFVRSDMRLADCQVLVKQMLFDLQVQGKKAFHSLYQPSLETKIIVLAHFWCNYFRLGLARSSLTDSYMKKTIQLIRWPQLYSKQKIMNSVFYKLGREAAGNPSFFTEISLTTLLKPARTFGEFALKRVLVATDPGLSKQQATLSGPAAYQQRSRSANWKIYMPFEYEESDELDEMSEIEQRKQKKSGKKVEKVTLAELMRQIMSECLNPSSSYHVESVDMAIVERTNQFYMMAAKACQTAKITVSPNKRNGSYNIKQLITPTAYQGMNCRLDRFIANAVCPEAQNLNWELDEGTMRNAEAAFSSLSEKYRVCSVLMERAKTLSKNVKQLNLRELSAEFKYLTTTNRMVENIIGVKTKNKALFCFLRTPLRANVIMMLRTIIQSMYSSDNRYYDCVLEISGSLANYFASIESGYTNTYVLDTAMDFVRNCDRHLAGILNYSLLAIALKSCSIRRQIYETINEQDYDSQSDARSETSESSTAESLQSQRFKKLRVSEVETSLLQAVRKEIETRRHTPRALKSYIPLCRAIYSACTEKRDKLIWEVLIKKITEETLNVQNDVDIVWLIRQQNMGKSWTGAFSVAINYNGTSMIFSSSEMGILNYVSVFDWCMLKNLTDRELQMLRDKKRGLQDMMAAKGIHNCKAMNSSILKQIIYSHQNSDRPSFQLPHYVYARRGVVRRNINAIVAAFNDCFPEKQILYSDHSEMKSYSDLGYLAVSGDLIMNRTRLFLTNSTERSTKQMAVSTLEVMDPRVYGIVATSYYELAADYFLDESAPRQLANTLAYSVGTTFAMMTDEKVPVHAVTVEESRPIAAQHFLAKNRKIRNLRANIGALLENIQPTPGISIAGIDLLSFFKMKITGEIALSDTLPTETIKRWCKVLPNEGAIQINISLDRLKAAEERSRKRINLSELLCDSMQGVVRRQAREMVHESFKIKTMHLISRITAEDVEAACYGIVQEMSGISIADTDDLITTNPAFEFQRQRGTWRFSEYVLYTDELLCQVVNEQQTWYRLSQSTRNDLMKYNIVSGMANWLLERILIAYIRSLERYPDDPVLHWLDNCLNIPREDFSFEEVYHPMRNYQHEGTFEEKKRALIFELSGVISALEVEMQTIEKPASLVSQDIRIISYHNELRTLPLFQDYYSARYQYDSKLVPYLTEVLARRPVEATASGMLSDYLYRAPTIPDDDDAQTLIGEDEELSVLGVELQQLISINEDGDQDEDLDLDEFLGE